MAVSDKFLSISAIDQVLEYEALPSGIIFSTGESLGKGIIVSLPALATGGLLFRGWIRQRRNYFIFFTR